MAKGRGSVQCTSSQGPATAEADGCSEECSGHTRWVLALRSKHYNDGDGWRAGAGGLVGGERRRSWPSCIARLPGGPSRCRRACPASASRGWAGGIVAGVVGTPAGEQAWYRAICTVYGTVPTSRSSSDSATEEAPMLSATWSERAGGEACKTSARCLNTRAHACDGACSFDRHRRMKRRELRHDAAAGCRSTGRG